MNERLPVPGLRTAPSPSTSTWSASPSRMAVVFAVALVALAFAVAATGCGDPEDPALDPAVEPGAPSLEGDQVAMAALGGAGAAETAAETLGALGDSSGPKVIYLAYADGTALPKTSVNPCKGAAPKFVCSFAPTLSECQRQIQTYLDRWYADFNVVFTLTRPTSGKFYTEVVSSGGGAWCDAESRVAGLAPFLCGDIDGGVAYTFLGGRTAKETAVIIAQEQAHLVGLEHTSSQRDIMNPTICAECDGFEDADNRVPNGNCNRSHQNSYEMMKDRLGAWPGGAKPTPFGCSADAVAPSVSIGEPADGASVSSTFTVRAAASDDCRVSRVNIAVSPKGLTAESTAPPFEWRLANLSGRQTITVTATDPSGKTGSRTITVTAGGARSSGSADGGAGADAADPGAGASGGDGAGGGCAVAPGARAPATPGLAALIAAALALLALRFTSRARVAPTRARRPRR
jgi:hypothetical protein